jgi:hypothetical protein
MKKFIFKAIATILIVFALIIYWKYSFTYSEGYRAGLLQKISYKGNIFKTYEGEMILSSIQSSANVALASEKFFFSVTNKEVAIQLEKLQGQNVIVHYREKNGTLPWKGESTYFVDSLKINNSPQRDGNH